MEKIKENLWSEFTERVAKEDNAKVFTELSKNSSPKIVIIEGVMVVREQDNSGNFDGKIMPIVGNEESLSSFLQKYKYYLEEK